MSTETPVGLVQYPVTKLCMITSVVLPVLAVVADFKYIFFTSYEPFISEYYQYFRLGIFQLCPLTDSEAFLYFLVWYHFRSIERSMASYKYISLISLIFIYTTLVISSLYLAINAFMPVKVWNRLPNGPLPIILALFHFYKEYTPRIYEFNLKLSQPQLIKGRKKDFIWTLNDQSYINILIILIMVNQGGAGIGCGFLSWLIGVFLDKGLLPGVNRCRLPFIKNIINKYSIDVRYTSNSISLNDRRNDTNETLERSEMPANPSPPTDEPTVNDEPPRPMGTQFLDMFR